MMVSVSGIDIPSEYKIQHYSPTYFKIFLDAEQLDFIYKEGEDRCEDISSPIVASSESDHDLTGSPLKLALADESFNDQIKIHEEITQINLWLPSEEKHRQLPHNDAAMLLIHFDSKKGAPKKLGVWVWFLVNNSQFALIGSRIMNGWWNNANIKILSPMLYSKINLNLILEDHLKMAKLKLNDVTTNITTEYDLTEKILNDSEDSIVGDIKQQSVKLEIKSRGLSLTDYHFAETTLKQEIIVGLHSSAAFQLWDDSCILQKLLNLILKNQNTSIDLLYNVDMPNSCNQKSIIDEVQAVLHAMSDDSDEKDHIKVFKDLEDALKLVQVRPNINFCSRLWIVLKECSTYTQLLNCLNTVITDVACGNYNMKLEDKSTTHLETLLREVRLGRTTISCLTGLQPLELLLEIGVEKLCQDYIYLFDLCKLSKVPLPFYNIPDEKLSKDVEKLSFLPRLTVHPGAVQQFKEEKRKAIFQNSKFEIQDYNHKFKILARAQVVVEYLLISATVFRFDMGILQDLCSKLMNTVIFEKDQSYKPPSSIQELVKHPKQSISLSENSTYFMQAINNKHPNSILVTFDSKLKFKNVIAKFNFNTKSIFPTGIYQPEGLLEDSDKEDNLYYVTRYYSYERRIPYFE